MFLVSVILLNFGYLLAAAREDADKYLVPCQTWDYDCLKQQYTSLRDHVLLGTARYVIDVYKPFIFKYGDGGICVKMSGVEKSEMIAVSLDNTAKKYMIALKMPLKIEQLGEYDDKNATSSCLESKHGKMNSFTGNVTARVVYPFKINKMKHMYLQLGEEDVDLILDIPDLAKYKNSGGGQGRLYQMSEWAYEVVQRVDVAKDVLLPYTGRIRTAFQRIPLDKLWLLGPGEQYTSVNYSFTDLKDHLKNLVHLLGCDTIQNSN